MIKLKTILQCKYLYIILLIISLIYAFINNIIIKYDSIYMNETNFDGIINSYKIDGDKLTITLDSKESIIANYYFNDEIEKKYFIDNIKYGTYVYINGSVSDIKNNTMFNTFNYKNYLYNKKIYKTINIKSLTINNDNITLLDKIRNNINERINDIDNMGYIKTFIMGDKSSIDINDINNYKNLGVSHLFAISGMHITLFSSTILYILNRLKKNKNLSIIISLIILFIYALICNFPSSIIRAYTMYLLLSLNKIFKLDIKIIYILILTIVINISINSFIIFDIGYLYSISTCLGLILLGNKINNNNYIINLFKVSLVAYLFSLPITINNNYEINMIAPINNILIVPLVSLIVYPLSLISFICPIIYPIFNISCKILLFIINILVKINIFNIVIHKLNIISIVIYYLFLYLTMFKSNKYIILIVLFLICVKYYYVFDDSYYVYFYDVGQGDSAALIYPRHSKVILIDTGGKVERKESWQERKNKYYDTDNIINSMKSIGITNFDYLIISHGDYDHMGEAINLVNNFKVEKVIFNCGPYNDLERKLIKVLDKKKIKYYSCIKELNIDKNKLYFLQTKEYDNENDNSNVIYTELDGYKFMLMGDASITTEKEIISKYNLPDIDVLKVGHHGSKTSSSKEFLDEINPKYSIISVGKNNRYGHPNKETLKVLDNTKIYRTDEDGSIMFKIKNNKLQIETCKP